jgi:hypothetical protein
MADPIRRLQSGNVPLTGVSNLPQPNMNFGTQRPEIAYQAQAESASTLSRVISGLSTSMFSQAERLAEAAGAQFVMENPPDQAQLEAMSKGDPGAFKKNFTLNAYQASIQKFRAIELSAHAEVEVTKAAGIMQRRIETGKYEDGTTPYNVDTKKVVGEFQSMINGWSSSLAAVSPDAAYKYRATAATHANRVLQVAAKKETEIALAKNKVKIASDVDTYSNTVANIIQNALPVPGLSINQEIEAEKARIVTNAITLGGADAGNFALEQLGTIERDIKTAYLENAVVSRMEGLGGDLASLNARIKSGNLPPDLQRVWDSMSLLDQKKARDKMAAQYQQLIDVKQKDKDIQKIDLTSRANSATMTYLDMNSTEDEKATALNTLREISNNDSTVVSAKFVQVDLPAMLKKDVEDDYESVAILRDKLSRKDPNLTTTEDILRFARANRIKPDTALKLAGEFLPKDAALADKKTKAQQIEFDLRTKKISTTQQLEVAVKAVGLTMADAPQDWPALLSAKPEDADDDPRAVALLIDKIDNGVITSAIGVADAAKGSRIKGETVIALGKRVGDRSLQLNNKAKSGANDIVDDSGVRNPQAKAQTELAAQEAIKIEFTRLQGEWDKSDKTKARPTMDDAARNVRRRFLDDNQQKKYETIQNDLISAYGQKGTSLPNSAKEANINLAGIPPTFKPGKSVIVSDEYRRRLIDELKKVKASQAEIDAIVESVIRSQIQLETIARNRRVQ